MLFDEGQYEVFELDYSWPVAMTRARTMNACGQATVDMEPGVMAIVTEDAWAIEPSAYGVDDSPVGIAHEELSDGAGAERFQQMLQARGEGARRPHRRSNRGRGWQRRLSTKRGGLIQLAR